MITFFLLSNALVNIDILSRTVGSLKHSFVKASLASDSSALSVFTRLVYYGTLHSKMLLAYISFSICSSSSEAKAFHL